jgi:O-antigen ligase
MPTWVQTLGYPMLLYFFLFTGLIKGIFPFPLDLTLVLMVILCVMLIHKRKSFEGKWNFPFVSILGTIVCLFLIRLYPNFSEFGLQKTSKFLTLGVTAFYSGYYLFRNKHLYSKFISSLWISSLLFTPVLLFKTYSVPIEETRFHGIGSGGYQLTGTILMLGCFAAIQQERYFVAGTLFFAMTLTGSVGPFSVAALSLITLYIFRRQFRRAVSRGFLVSILLTVTFTLFQSVPYSMERAYLKGVGLQPQLVSQETSDGIVSQETSDGTRLGLFLRALNLFLENPWLGIGTGNFVDGVYSYPHNFLLEFGSEFGISGLLIALVLIFYIFKNLRGTDDSFVWCATLAFLTTLMFSGFFGERTFLFTLGILSADSRMRSVDDLKR